MTSTPPEAASLLDSAIKTDEQDLRVAQLVASYSLLDPQRRDRRRDIVLSTLVAVLAERQPMSSHRLFRAIREMWKTSTLTDDALSSALKDAEAARLIAEHDDNGEKVYSVLSDAADETRHDQDYVVSLLRDFQIQISDRSAGYPKISGKRQQQERLMREVLTAIAKACQDSYAIDSPGTSRSVRPLSVSQSAIIQYANKLEPASIRIPVRDLALDALDTGDPFGNEVVHLIVVSGLLLGLTTQRGIAAEPSLEHMKVILDTSSLIGLVSPAPHPDNKAIHELISLSDRCKTNLVVAQHTIDEWRRLWDGADGEMKYAEKRVETIISPILARLVTNPFVFAYINYRNSGGTHGWIRWSEPGRNLRHLLEGLPITVENYVEEDEADQQCRERLFSTLQELSEDSRVKGRTRAAAEADARTATMIAKWRKNNGQGSAVFVARDNLTNRAYTRCFPDARPLVIWPTVWLQYVGCLIVDDPVSQIDIADLIADVAVRDTVLGMAGSHTLDEVLDFSDLLTSEGIEISAQLARDLDDPLLFDAADVLHQESGEDFLLRARAAIARRGSRRNQRATYREAQLQTELNAMQQVVDDRSSEADTQRTRAESEQQRADGMTREKEVLAESNSRLRRTLHAVSSSAVALILLVALSGWGFLNGWAIVFGVFVAALGGLYAFRWIDDTESKPRRMWIAGFLQVVWHIVSSILF